MAKKRYPAITKEEGELYHYLIREQFIQKPSMALATLERTLTFSEPYGREEFLAWGEWKDLNRQRDISDSVAYPHLRPEAMMPTQRRLQQLQAAQLGALRLAIGLTDSKPISERKGHLASLAANEWAELYIELKQLVPGFPVDSVRDCVTNPTVAQPLRVAAMTVASRLPDLRTLLQKPVPSSAGPAEQAAQIIIN